MMTPNKNTVTDIIKFPKKDKEDKVSDPKQYYSHENIQTMIQVIVEHFLINLMERKTFF